jgi:3-oxoacyl-[acyl-carrier-protein] synthase-3
LRQDIRLLPHLFDVSIHEYVRLVKQGWVQPDAIDHFLCHYSSSKFEGVVEELLARAGLSIDKDRWYSNLKTRGNTGAASIFVMLDEFLRERSVTPGQTILCFVPESARIAASYFLLTVCDAQEEAIRNSEAGTRMQSGPSVASPPRQSGLEPMVPSVEPPHRPENAVGPLRDLLLRLAGIWHDYRSEVFRTRLVTRLCAGKLTMAEYRDFTEDWIPQVRVGTGWMRAAVSQLREEYQPLAQLIQTHAGEEQDDFQILYRDYQALGGQIPLDDLVRNPGGAALHAYLSSVAQTPNPVGLLGAIYIIEGTGQRIIPALLPLLQKHLRLSADQTRFLAYHGENDSAHLARWLKAVEITLGVESANKEAICRVAENTATLYLMQWQHLRTRRQTGEIEG